MSVTQTQFEAAVEQQYDGNPAVTVGWTDLRAPATTIRQGATGKPDFDTTDLGLLFPQNDPDEIAYIIMQLPHEWKEGSELRPHIHYIQDEAEVPVFKMEYRWTNNGAAPAGSFTTLTQNGLKFIYVSGSLMQVATFPAIDGTGKTLSSILEVKLYRDDNVVSGAVLVKEFDVHYQIDQERGSRQESVK